MFVPKRLRACPAASAWRIPRSLSGRSSSGNPSAASACRSNQIMPALYAPARQVRRLATGARGARRLADQQAPPEYALERLPVAVALDAPARQREVAGRLQVEVDAVTVGAQP